MKLKTGIDLVEIQRIERSMQNSHFLPRVFHQTELELFKNRNYAVQTVAVNFAAKEAFAKALGTGVVGFGLHDIAVLRDSLGAPYLQLHGRARALVSLDAAISVSLTHTDRIAGAVVTILQA